MVAEWGWNNQSYDEELVCSLGLDEDMVVVEFNMCSVLVVGVFDRLSLLVVVVFLMCS